MPGRVVEVGCNGHCYAEPLVTIQKEGWPPILYGSVKPGVARVLVQRFLGEDDPCFEHILGGLEPHELVPALEDVPSERTRAPFPAEALRGDRPG